MSVLSATVLVCAIVLTLVDAGKKVAIKIQVPELIKHKHHTNIVFVHKHHHHYHDDDHGKPKHHHVEPAKPKQHHHQSGHLDDYGDHYSHSYGDPYGHHHSHSYGHHHHYSHGTPKKKPNPKPKVHKVHKAHKPKPALKKPILKEPGKSNYYSYGGGYFNLPKTEVEHYVYSTSSPILHFDENNNLKQSNESIKHERLKVETFNGNPVPEVENYSEFTKTQSNYGYEVEEPGYDYGFQPYSASYGNFKDSEDKNNEEDEQKKGLGSYSEDYTNPNSVAKYTSDIQHGNINLEDSSYNPEHGNELEDYIKNSEGLDDY